jgi:hypothetical protein
VHSGLSRSPGKRSIMQIEEQPQGDSIRSTETHADFLWGCEAISKAIGRNKRVTFWLLENGELFPVSPNDKVNK